MGYDGMTSVGLLPAKEAYAKWRAAVTKALNSPEAIEKLDAALSAFAIEGPKNNIPAVLAVLRSEPFRAGRVHTGLIPEVLGKKS